MQQIPILVNRKGSNIKDITFKIFPLQEKLKSLHKRQKTQYQSDTIISQQKRHETLDPQILKKGQTRYRRVSSSSAASNKFPRDFFKQNMPPTPIKIRFSRQRKQKPYESQRNNLIKFRQKRAISYDNRQSKRTINPQLNINVKHNEQEFQHISQVQTPKFNHRDLNATINNKDYLYEEQSNQSKFTSQKKQQNKINKIGQYLTQKKYKQNINNIFSKKSLIKLSEFDCPQLHSKVSKQSLLIQQNKKNNQSFNSNLNKNQGLNQILLQTLGKRQNVLSQFKCQSIDKNNKITNTSFKILKLITNSIPSINNNNNANDKQNITQHYLQNQQTQMITTAIHSKMQKNNIKAFLSSKLVNWKHMQKVNFNKKKSAEINNIKINKTKISQTNDDIINEKSNENQQQVQKAQKRQNLLVNNLDTGNNFRIRKYY